MDRVYDGLEQVPQAHDDMEHDRAAGKLVVRVRHQNNSHATAEEERTRVDDSPLRRQQDARKNWQRD